MSGAVARAGDATDAARRSAAGPRPGRNWLDSVKNEAITFLKGDNNAPWAILADTVLGCVPILGQLIDARDVIKGLAEVGAAPQSPSAWFDLITAVIGIVPGGGDAVKRSLRAVKHGTVQIDDLLALIRRVYKGDPEELIRRVVDPSKIVAKLDEILANPTLLKNVSAEARQSIERIRGDIGAHATALKREVAGWLAKGRKTSAQTGPATRPTPGAPQAKPQTTVKEGQRTKGEHSGDATHTTPNAATQRAERIRGLGNKAMGVFGEHMADYHCQDVKGWYATARVRHDKGHINIAKMNDGGELVQLWPLKARGRGIDAVWRTEKGHRPFAIIEAKASVDPTRSLNSLLGDASDKTEDSTGHSSPAGRRNGRSGSSKGSAGSAESRRQQNGRVAQMSHEWIRRRVESAVAGETSVVTTFRRLRDRAYTRHVLFFSVPHAAAHTESLITLLAGRPLDAAFHGAHELTREWGDNQIEQVVNDRAGLSTESRRRR